MQERIPAVLMRGGTSKGLFFHSRHLPSDPEARKALILRAYGSPDPYRRQTDGLGGGIATASKVAIIGPSDDPAYDVEYNFGQVAIDRPHVEFNGGCGNISSGVGPFAIDEGLVNGSEPVTTVRILQKNTGKLVIAEVPVRQGRFEEDGEYAIAGVPGTGSKIVLRFVDPGGAVTGKLFPTGNPCDLLQVGSLGTVPVTIMDAANPVVFVQAARIGLMGAEIDEIDADPAVRSKLEAIRSHAAVLMGLASTPGEASFAVQSVPKMAMVAPAKTYRTTGGNTIEGSQFNLLVRIMCMGALHRSYGVTGAICTAGAASMEGTVVHEVLGGPMIENRVLILGHPGGTIEIGVLLRKESQGWVYREAAVCRTARRLMEGHVLVPRKHRPEA